MTAPCSLRFLKEQKWFAPSLSYLAAKQSKLMGGLLHHIYSLLLNATRAISTPEQLTPSALLGFWSFKTARPSLLLGDDEIKSRGGGVRGAWEYADTHTHTQTPNPTQPRTDVPTSSPARLPKPLNGNTVAALSRSWPLPPPPPLLSRADAFVGLELPVLTASFITPARLFKRAPM